MAQLPTSTPLAPEPPGSEPKFLDDKRLNFLLEMYRQLLNDINRHITIVWQTLGVVGTAVASLALVEKHIVSIDVTITFITITCAWACTQILDAGYWYNRNLCIVSNIERQFLKTTDQKDIHFYFGSHRPNNKMLSHLRNQLYFVIAIAALMVGYHLCVRIAPEVLPHAKGTAFHGHFLHAVPEITFVLAAVVVNWVRKECNRKYAEFLEKSPGITIDTSGIEYGIGHGYPDEKPQKLSKNLSIPPREWTRLKILLTLLLGVSLLLLFELLRGYTSQKH